MASVESSLTLTSQGVLIAPLWTPNHTTANGNYYKVDSLVNYEIDGVLLVHRCIADNDSAVPTDTMYWLNLGPGYLIQQEKPDWNATEGDSQILNKPNLTGYITDAPDDGSQYVRKNESWSKLTNYSEDNPTSASTPLNGFPLGSDWYNTVTGEKFYQKANGVWISYTSSTPPVDGGDSPVVFANLATTVQLPNSPVYDNGMGGLGATLIASSNGVLSVDGPIGSTVVGDTILVKDQPAFDFDTELDFRYQNGVYILSQQGSSTLPYILTRVDYADESTELYPSQVNILDGATNKNRYFLQKTEDPTLGLDPIDYVINYVPPTQVIVLPLIHVDTATTAPLPDCTYVDEFAPFVPGSPYLPSPIMSYLTATTNGPLGIINGVNMSILFSAARNRKILIKNQVDPIQNGDYEVIQIGSSVQPWKLRRITTSYYSFDKNVREWKINNEASTLYGNRYYMNYSSGFTGVVGSDPITFSELEAGGGSQSLQDVTDVGNTTDNDIQFGTGAGVYMNNGSRLKEGTIDAGYGGSKGIAQICAVGYELKWEAGRLYVMGDGGTTIREVSHNFTTVPTNYNDISQGFIVGSRWLLDDGTLYVCTDNTDDTAVWELQVIGTQDLQSVTDNGATTTNTITVGDIAGNFSQVLNSAIGTENAVTGTYAYLDASGFLGLHNGDFESDLKNTNVTNAGVILEFPDKPTGSYTIATTTDIPAVDSTPTNGSTNAVSSDGVFDALALKADLVAGKVPSSQLPSYVDDVIEGYYSAPTFYSNVGLTTPIVPETGKIYVDLLANKSYRWSGSIYVQISNAISGLDDLTDVTVSTPLNGQLIQYNSTTSQWENQSITVGTGDMQKSTYDIDNDGVVDYSETIAITVRNPSTSSILRRGTIVYLNGSTGYRPNAYKAQANSEATSSGTFGVVVSDIGLNSDGLVAAIGTLHNLDTRTAAGGATYPFTSDTLADGDALWLDPNTAGYVTKVKPSAPNHIVFVGTVARTHPTLGRIVYRIANGFELEELHNVSITTPLDNQVVTYEASTSLWKNKTISQGTPLTRQEFSYIGAQTFTLSATPSYIYAVFVNGQELNSSQYSFVTTTLTIADTLESGDKINIVYSETAGGVLDYYTKAQIDAFNYEEKHINFIEINDLVDLPSASGGVITLVAGYTYLFLKHIDLLGSRLVCGADTVIVGWSSENCSITSTGLSAATALVTSTYSLPIRNISFTHALVFDLQGDGTTTALDWFGVNLLNCASGGTIKNYTNFVAGDSALLNSGGFIFDGTIGTIAFSNCLFDCASTKTAISVLSTCTVSRRLRIIYSSFVVLSGETGVNFNTSATVGDEKYILDTCNFSGGGTYISGFDATSNKALFANCVGITNTSTRGFMHMLDNTTATAITGTASYFKASGTTTASSANSKFTSPSSNRLTYTGAFTQSFFVTVNCNVRTSVSTQTVNIVIAKNGTNISESEMTILCAAGSTPSFGGTQCVVELTANDYIELFVRNTSSVNNIIVSDLNMNVLKIPV